VCRISPGVSKQKLSSPGGSKQKTYSSFHWVLKTKTYFTGWFKAKKLIYHFTECFKTKTYFTGCFKAKNFFLISPDVSKEKLIFHSIGCMRKSLYMFEFDQILFHRIMGTM
jgi:hypothetical protein